MSDATDSGYSGATIPAQRPSSNTFLFRVNIFILGAMALVFLYRLPRGIALFGSSEWFSGHILRHIPYRPSRSASRSRRIVQVHHSSYPPHSASSPTNLQNEGTTDESHTLAYHYNQQSFKRLDARGREIQMQYPTHIASCPRFLRWALPTLRYRITPSYSVGQGILLMAYFWVLFYTTVLNSNFFVDYNRVGWIATAQLPFVMAYGAKNNVLGTLWGMGYERLNYLHRFAGRMVVIGANLHGIGFAYRWSLAGTFTASVRIPQNMWGLVALICLDVLWLFSLAFWRNNFYNLFIVTHVTCFSVLMPGLWFHKPRLIPYVLVTVIFFGLDYVLRLIKTRVVTATIRPLSELDLTRIEVPNINAGWRAGQHVRVRILSSGMGWFGWSEMHPFTIASVGVSDGLGESGTGNGRKARGAGGEEGMVLMCKKTGRWTNRLFEMAKMSGYVDGWMGREVKVWIEGPYGGPGHTNFSSFSAAVIVVAGSGITFALSVVRDLVEKDIKGMSRLKAIELICVVPDHTSILPLLPTLTTLIHRSVFTPLRISIHYTRASATQPSIPSIPGLMISPGRPRIAKIVDHAVSKALVVGTRFDHLMDVNATIEVGQSEKNKKKGDYDHDASRSNSRRDGSRSHGSHGHEHGNGKGNGNGKNRKLEVDVEMEKAIDGNREKEDIHEITGVIVGVCGPVELGKDVVNAVGSIDKERRDRVGGIEVHEEVFGW